LRGERRNGHCYYSNQKAHQAQPQKNRRVFGFRFHYMDLLLSIVVFGYEIFKFSQHVSANHSNRNRDTGNMTAEGLEELVRATKKCPLALNCTSNNTKKRSNQSYASDHLLWETIVLTSSFVISPQLAHAKNEKPTEITRDCYWFLQYVSSCFLPFTTRGKLRMPERKIIFQNQILPKKHVRGA